MSLFVSVLFSGEQVSESRLAATGSIGVGAQEALLEELSRLDERRTILAREHGLRILEAAMERALQRGVTGVDVRQGHDDLVATLLELQEDTRLFVLGQHDEQHKPKRFLLDHNLEGAIRALQRPIMVATTGFREPNRFMIAFDGSATARKMVEMVAASPILQGMSCSLVTVGEANDSLSHAKSRLSEAGFKVQAAQLQGEAVDALTTYAENEGMDMLVMGAYGHSRIRHLVVGSTTTALLQRTRIPVFILR